MGTKKAKRNKEAAPASEITTFQEEAHTQAASQPKRKKQKLADASVVAQEAAILPEVKTAEQPNGLDKDAGADGEKVAYSKIADGIVGQKFRNKEKTLLLTSRGIPPRFRHLMLDLTQLIVNAKKDAKLDTKSQRHVINEVADIKGCNDVVFFETRKHQDLYIWLAKAPSGPTVKFHCTNVHTMAELKLSGNHLKGSRPILSFSQDFDKQPHWQLIKELLTHVFATPKGHPKSKPFVDHVINFSIADNRLWIRNYQTVTNLDKRKVTADSISLVETGPRLTLNPIRITTGSFQGPVIYSNPTYVSPNLIRAEAKRRKAGKYKQKILSKQQRKQHALNNVLPVSELADVFQE